MTIPLKSPIRKKQPNTHHDMGAVSTTPGYIRIFIGLMGLYVLISMLSIGQYILVPLIYAVFIAISLHPIINRLLKWHFPLILAIILTMLILSLALLGLITLIISQASNFSKEAPMFLEKAGILVDGLTGWLAFYLKMDEKMIIAWIKATQADLINNSGNVIATTLTTAGGVLAALFLTPVYVFMLLYYHTHIMTFIHQSFGRKEHVTEILSGTKNIVQKYILGLIAANGIVAVLNTVGLLILGIQYALLLGLIGALLNLIPYLGGIIAVIIYMFIALVTKPPVYVLYVLILYGIIQFIDNNYIVPKIVGSTVALNALACLLAVIGGAALWGIPGMFISIPVIAVLKIILDRIESLAPIGFLLGNGIRSDEKIADK